MDAWRFGVNSEEDCYPGANGAMITLFVVGRVLLSALAKKATVGRSRRGAQERTSPRSEKGGRRTPELGRQRAAK